MAIFQRADLSSLALLGSALGVALLLASSFSAWFRLRHIKGPFLASFSYIWMFKATTSGSQYDTYGDVFKKYGKLVRIGPNDLITGSLDVLQRMNSARSQYKRSTYYSTSKLDPYTDCLFSIGDNATHDKLKGQMAYGYGGKEVPTLESDIDEQIQTLINVLRRKYAHAEASTPVDFAHMMHYFTLDVITKLAYGTAFGHLETETDVIGYMKSSTSQLDVIALCAEIPLIGKLLLNPWVFRLFGPKKTDSSGLGKLIRLSEELVSGRLRTDADDQQDMLGSFIRHGVSKIQCESEIPFQVVAGSDTTAHAIRSTLLYLMTSPPAYRKLQDEIVEAAAHHSISTPVTTAEAKNLPYLQAVINEGLRLNPPATLLLMKETPVEGDTIDGYFVPGGTRVAMSLKPVMLDPTIFGDDVETFRPERWLDVEPQQKRYMAEAVDMVFGHGRWGCLGKTVALMELNKVLVQLLRNFDFQLVNPRCPIEDRKNIQVWVERGMWVRVMERA